MAKTAKTAKTNAPAKTNASAPAKGKTYRPEVLASALGISGKIVRAYLRTTFPRPADAKGTTWVLNAKQAEQTLKHFRSRNPRAND